MEVLFGDTAIGHALMTIISFSLLMFVINRFAFQPIMTILEERKEKIRVDITSAQTNKVLSDEANQKAQHFLDTAQTQANQIIADTRKQSDVLKQSLEAKAKEDILVMQQEAKKNIATQRTQIISDMEKTVSVVSIEIAEKIIQREVKEADHRKLISQFIQRLEAEINHES